MEKDSKIYPPEGGTQSKIVQTLAEDMAKVIEDDRSGLIKKIIHEEEKHEKEKRAQSPESKKNKLFMILSLLFVALGLVTLFYFMMMKKDAPAVDIKKQFIPLIFNDQSAFIEVKDLKKDEIAQTVLNEVNQTEVKNGGVEGIYLTENKQVIGLRRFITLIEGSLSLPNSTLFVNDNFLLGVVKTETQPVSSASRDFFILLKARSTADIFDALRASEEKMFFDLQGFFGYSVSPETEYLLTKKFQDGILENKNTRVLYDSDNKIIMMYILADENSVVITNTEKAAREIMLRLAASRIKK